MFQYVNIQYCIPLKFLTLCHKSKEELIRLIQDVTANNSIKSLYHKIINMKKPDDINILV